MDGRVNPRIKSGDGQDGRGSEASWRQPTHSYRYKSSAFYCQSQKYLLGCSGGSDLAKGDEKGEAGDRGCE